MKLCRLAAIVSALRLAAAADRDPMEMLKLAAGKVGAAGARIPNYTCVETVTRSYFRPTASRLPRDCSVLLDIRQHPTPDMLLKLSSKDRLRLDVAMLKNGEVFSWVGASKFDDHGIDRLVQGPMGTGAFAGFLIVVFQQDTKQVAFERTVAAGGRNLMEYSFQVEQAASHYKIRSGDGWIYTAYSGSFQVDPETHDVVRLTVETAQLPPDASQCMTTVAMDYHPVQIGSSRFLLPERAQQRFVFPTGEETENVTTFADCHEYRGESTIIYEDPVARETEGGVAAPPKTLEIPTGLRLVLDLNAPIDTDQAAAGDPFTARVAEPLLDADKKLLAPAGSMVEGRILRVQSYGDPQTDVVLVLQPESIEVKGVKSPLSAVRDWSTEMTASAVKGKQSIPVTLPLRGEERAAAFRFAGKNVVVKKGFRSQWRTR